MMVKDKFGDLLNELKLTPEEFGVKINIGKSSIYKILRGDTKKITKKLAEKIHHQFPNYSIAYLLSFNFLKTEKASIKEYPSELLTEEEIKIVSDVILLKEAQILEIPFFKKWLKEKVLEGKLEVYEKYEKLMKKE